MTTISKNEFHCSKDGCKDCDEFIYHYVCPRCKKWFHTNDKYQLYCFKSESSFK